MREIHLYSGSSAYDLTQPPEDKRSPRTIVDAQFSVPFVVAAALVKGKVTLEDFTDKGIRNETILQLTSKIISHHDPALDRHGVEPGRVSVVTTDGSTYDEHVEYCLGSIQNPMSFDDCAAKFRECAPFSIHPMDSEKVEHAIDTIVHLEEMDDATRIFQLIS
jgi:2-methylcitrate dehydratase PrpD